MITEVLLLHSYLILSFIWWPFQHLIKIMADVGNIFNNNEFFGDIVDTPKEGIEQHKKREELKDAVDKGRLYKWTHRKVDKASNEIINKMYAV